MVRRVKVSSRLMLRRFKRFVVHRILHADDPPHKIALGVALGMLVAFTPTVGFQMIIVVILAWIFRANKLAGLPVVWITNPVTIVPIYYPCYVLGTFLMGREHGGKDIFPTAEQLAGTWWHKVTTFWNFTLEIFGPLWIGGLTLGIITGAIAYFAVTFIITKHRKLFPPRKYINVDSLPSSIAHAKKIKKQKKSPRHQNKTKHKAI